MDFADASFLPIFFSSLLPKACFLLGSFIQLALFLLVLTYCSISGKQCNNAKAMPKHLFSNGGMARVLHMQEE
jgi:hypothetical protein